MQEENENKGSTTPIQPPPLPSPRITRSDARRTNEEKKPATRSTGKKCMEKLCVRHKDNYKTLSIKVIKILLYIVSLLHLKNLLPGCSGSQKKKAGSQCKSQILWKTKKSHTASAEYCAKEKRKERQTDVSMLFVLWTFSISGAAY